MPQRFIAGDPLRAVAALSVVVFHIAAAGLVRGGDPFGPVLTDVLGSLQLGIYVFFALSGYLLTRPFLAGPVDRRRYARNRLLRIVPAFWAVALVVLVVVGAEGASAGEVLAVFAFAQTYAESGFSAQIVQGWTLGAEVLFYALLPLAFLLRPRALVAVFVVVTAVTLTWRMAQDGDRFTPPVMLYAFAPGVILAVLEARGRTLPPLGCVVAGAALLAAYVAVEDGAARAVLGVAGCGLLVAGPLAHQWRTGRAWRMLDNRAMHYLGERSYAIYLVHVPLIIPFIGAYAEHGPWSAAARIALVSVPLTLLAAELLHRLVERPFLTLRAA